MGECRYCNEKGFFVKVNSEGKCTKCANNPTRFLKYVRINNPDNLNTNELQQLYEQYLYVNKFPAEMDDHIFLANLYRKNKLFDKAWKHLNNAKASTMGTDFKEKYKIESEMYKVLRDEEKHYADQVRHLGMSILMKAGVDNNFIFKPEKFSEELRMGRALTDEDELLLRFANELIETLISEKNYDPNFYLRECGNFYKSIKKTTNLKEGNNSKNNSQIQSFIDKLIVSSKYFNNNEIWDYIISSKDKIKKLSKVSGDGFEEEQKGFSLEDKGDIKNALLYYYVSIEKGFDAPALYSRVAINLRKIKHYEEEARILSLGIKNVSDYNNKGLIERLDKLNNKLLNK